MHNIIRITSVTFLLVCSFCSPRNIPKYASRVYVSEDGHSVYFDTDQSKQVPLFRNHREEYMLSEMSVDGNFVLLYCTPDSHAGQPGRIEQFAVLYRLPTKEQIYPEDVGLKPERVGSLTPSYQWIGFSKDQTAVEASCGTAIKSVDLASLLSVRATRRPRLRAGAPTCQD